MIQMAWQETEWKKAIKQAQNQSIYYFISEDAQELQRRAKQTKEVLLQTYEMEYVRLPAKEATIERLSEESKIQSFFQTKRCIEVIHFEPSSLSSADCTAFCTLIAENKDAVFLITTLLKDKKAKTNKKLQQIVQAAEKYGFFAECLPLTSRDIQKWIAQCAAQQNTQITPQAIEALHQRVGNDLNAIQQEMNKLSAVCGYTEITEQRVVEMTFFSLQADVFDMVRAVQQERYQLAYQQLQRLMMLQQEPILIVSALCASFIDLYRIKCAQQAQRTLSQMMQDFQIKGSEWRFQKAAQMSAGYTKQELLMILHLLQRLDERLKTSSVDQEVLLQWGLSQMMQIGGRR